jgi:glutamyl-tRNA synthetase
MDSSGIAVFNAANQTSDAPGCSMTAAITTSAALHKPVVRFAPSPTGSLHIGNIRTATMNWLLAKKHGGTFILRMDDTDVARSTEAFADGIRADLTWLGLTWAREERQSARSARYAEVAAQLKASGRLYACYEAEDELDRRRKRQMARGLPPIYDRASLKLTPEEHAALATEGRKPHWRFRLANTEPSNHFQPVPTLTHWLDLIRGDQNVDVGSLSDPVLIREDGSCLYTFTSVVDDIDFGISHIIRGEDHVTNSGVQIQLFEALGAVPPQFAHHSLLVGKDGDALSKRTGALSVASLRDDGLEPMAVTSHAGLLGTSDAIEAFPSLAALAAPFDLSKFARAPARFDPDELLHLNARYLQAVPFAAVEARLRAMGAVATEPFWLAVRGNLSRFADVTAWADVVAKPMIPLIEDAAFCATAAGVLPPAPWDETTWTTWTNAVKAATGAKGKALFHPLRLALTGREAGPELKLLLPLIGRTKCLERLAGRTA